MKSIEQQRNVELPQGFSPKPLTAAAAEAGTSPSHEPETTSPNALLDGPVIQRANLKPQSASDVIVKDGIVSFGK
jgi:hypothetical protein